MTLATLENFAPDFQQEIAGWVARVGVAKWFSLLRAAVAHGGHPDHQPHFFGEWEFRDGDIAFHLICLSATQEQKNYDKYNHFNDQQSRRTDSADDGYDA